MSRIKCFDCYELTKTIDELDMTPLESIVEYADELQQFLVKYDEFVYMKCKGKLTCSTCNNKIAVDDYYIPDTKEMDFTRKVGQLIGEEISRYVDYCSHCDIIKELNQVNVVSLNHFGEMVYSEGEDITDFLKRHFVPYDYIENVIPFISCKCCGFGFDNINESWSIGRFDQSDKIFTSEDISSYLDIDMEDWHNFAEQYHVYLHSFELLDFLTYLQKTPMFAIKHSVGEKIFELFKSMYDAGDYRVLHNVNLYRGRKRNIGSKKYEPEEMWNPPFGVSSHGRYNIVGTSVLYLTSKKKYIPDEVNYSHGEKLDIATVRIKNPLKILDLSNLLGGFGRFLSQPADNRNILKLEYLLTNYISECCKIIGFHGVQYKGVKEGNYDNYAIINFSKNEDAQITSVEEVEVRIVYKL
ncbi:hypothetical protein [Brevibacillus sp. NRS-1366]|uniref:hypothetical protein n=1 Tax=Brevibacillus sp. NRS-1366 TaxID=3233899 RepID=UPI003D1B62DD